LKRFIGNFALFVVYCEIASTFGQVVLIFARIYGVFTRCGAEARKGRQTSAHDLAKCCGDIIG